MRTSLVARAALVAAGAVVSLGLAGAPAAVAEDDPPICAAPNPGNIGTGNTGAGNIGDDNTGDGNIGDANRGWGNTGDGNTGSGNTVDGNTGSGNTSYVSPFPYGYEGYSAGPDDFGTCP